MNSAELQVLIATYHSVTAEISRRHEERYKFYTVSLVLLGAMGALFTVNPGYVGNDVKAAVFSLAPIAFTAIIALVLKEHQYINMRDRYLVTVLRPRLAEIAGGPDRKFRWLSWEEFEPLQTGRQRGLPRRRERFLVFAILGLFDYAIPALLAVTSLVAYGILRPQVDNTYRILLDPIASCGAVVFVFMCALVIRLRSVEQRWYPGTPQEGLN